MLSSSECIAWFAVFVTESVAIFTVNLLSMIVFIKNKNLRTRGMYLVVNLTVADMFVGGVSSFEIVRLSEFHCSIVKLGLSVEGSIVIHFLFLFFSFASLTNIAVISLERMHATFRPFRHRVIRNWVYGVTVAVVWVFVAALSTAITIMGWFERGRSHYQYLWQSHTLLCLFLICISYASIVFKFRCGGHPQHHGAATRQRKLTITLFLMTIVSLLMWLPYAIGALVYRTYDIGTLYDYGYILLMRLNLSFTALFFANSLINPIVFTIKIPEFKKALIALFRNQQRENADIPLHVR